VLAGSRDVRSINQQLETFTAQAHLVTPATSCPSLPEGCEVAISLLRVDPDKSKDGPGDVSDVGSGKLSLSGTVLKKIGAAAGVSWDLSQSGRLDDASDPHYCHYRAVGWVRQFDGSMRCLSGEVEIDMRDGSPQVVAMKARANTEHGFNAQVRDTRLFILRHAETKAKLRAITDLGLKRSYTAAELQKPFAVARLMFTGRSDNPEIARMFAEKIADANLAGMLFGQQRQSSLPQPRQIAMVPQVEAPPPQVLHQRQPIPQFQGHAPPPVAASGTAELDDYNIDHYPDDADLGASAATAGSQAPTTTTEQTGKL
jgi:hypothetical protein